MRRRLAEEIRSNEKIAKEYQEWVSNPMTQAVYEELLMRSEPALLIGDKVRGDVSLYMLGLLTGWRRAIDAMVRLDSDFASSIDSESGNLTSEYREEM